MTDASAQSNDPPMLWNGWGDPAAAKPLSPGIRSLLEQALGIEPTDVAAPSLEQVRLRPSALSPSDREGIAAILGAEHVAVADHDRLLRAGGKSTLDLLRRRDFGVQDAPDAVLLPGSDDEVAAVLRFCADRSIAVVPFGGGTSVVGGLDPTRGRFKAVVSLDLRRLDRLWWLDEVSWEAELGAGASHSGIFRRASASPPSVASPPPARPGRIRRATGASTTWSAGCAPSPRRAPWTWVALPRRLRAPICVSCC